MRLDNFRILPQQDAARVKAALDAVYPQSQLASFDEMRCDVCLGQCGFPENTGYCMACRNTGWKGGMSPFG